jgi:metal-sulfur cluster biosynthetic enzyme
MSLIVLNMVRAVRVADRVLEVDLVMYCPGCPAGEAVLAQTHRSLSKFNGHTVRLNLLPKVWTPPWE